MKKKLPKVDIWANGCGANVGKHVIHFTGIHPEANPLHEGVYVTLNGYKGKWTCRPLIYIPSRVDASLRDAIRVAKMVRRKDLSWVPAKI